MFILLVIYTTHCVVRARFSNQIIQPDSPNHWIIDCVDGCCNSIFRGIIVHMSSTGSWKTMSFCVSPKKFQKSDIRRSRLSCYWNAFFPIQHKIFYFYLEQYGSQRRVYAPHGQFYL